MVARTRNARGIYPKNRSRFTKSPGKSKALPEYLEQAEVESLLRHAPHPQARLLMLIQWRAGLRVSEAIAITPADLALESDQPTMRVRLGKGVKDRMVPVHQELREVLYNVVYYRTSNGPIIGVSRQAADQWVQQALASAEKAGAIARGKRIGTHTLRHSFARHVLANGMPLTNWRRGSVTNPWPRPRFTCAVPRHRWADGFNPLKRHRIALEIGARKSEYD